jgi:hypothetical protein
MRLPGFWHQKGEPFQTHAPMRSDRPPYTAAQILAEFPPGETRSTRGNGHDGAVEAMAELVRQLLNAETFHGALRSLTWRYLTAGMAGAQVVETLRGFMLTIPEADRDDRWQSRFEEIPRTISMAQGKLERPNGEVHPAAEFLGKVQGTNRTDQSWPDPLDQAALYGLAGDVVRAIERHSEADPISLLLQFLAAFGNACGRGHYIPIEGDRHPPQVWGVLVGETAKARKGTSWGRVRQLFDQAAPVWAQDRIASGLPSGEGVIWQVRDPIVTKYFDKKKKEVVEAVVDEGVDDKRLLVLEPEFASPLRHMERVGNTLSGTLRCLWDRGDVRALTKNSPARTTGSIVSIVGHVTVEELKRYLTSTEMANGLANRFLFACVRRSKELPFGGAAVDHGDLAERVADRLSRIDARGEQRVMWTDGAKAIWLEVYHELSEGKPGMVGAVTSRAEAQTLRLALAYALLDGAVYVEPEHLRAALAVWRYCDQSAT